MCCISNVNIAQAADADPPPEAIQPSLSGVRKSESERERETEQDTREMRHREREIGGRMECGLLTVSLQQPTVVIQRAAFLVFTTINT